MTKYYLRPYLKKMTPAQKRLYQVFKDGGKVDQGRMKLRLHGEAVEYRLQTFMALVGKRLIIVEPTCKYWVANQKAEKE